MTGWNTAELMRNDVPDQKASMAVPWSFSVMIGRAILKEEASRAAARVIMAMDRNAKRNPLLGLKAGWKFSEGAMVGASFGSGVCRISGEGGVSIEGFSSRDETEMLFGDDIVVDVKERGEEVDYGIRLLKIHLRIRGWSRWGVPESKQTQKLLSLLFELRREIYDSQDTLKPRRNATQCTL